MTKIQQSVFKPVYRLFALTVLLVPFNAILGTTLLWGSFVSTFALIRVQTISFMECILICIILCFLFSLSLYTAEFGFSQRTVAALYNICILIFATTAFYYGRNIWDFDANTISFLQFERYGFCLWVCSSFFVAGTVLYASIHGAEELSLNTIILGYMRDLPGILKFYSSFPILGVDWLTEGAKPRPVGFGIYYTEGALTLALSAILAKTYIQRNAANFAIVVDVVTLMLLNEMGSRTLLLAYISGLAISILMSFKLVLQNSVLIVFMGAMALVSVVNLGGLDFINSLFQQGLSMRQGSTDLRFQSYAMAINMVLHDSFAFGLGVKPVDPALPDIPVGSHSTLVSFFTKGGAAALSFLAIFYLALIAKWCLAVARLGMVINPSGANWQIFKSLFRATLMFCFWVWTEDMDATFNASFLTFFLLGAGLGYIALLYRTHPSAVVFQR